MKRTIAILLSFIMVLCSIPFVANAADNEETIIPQIEINEENFPDEEFRKFVSETYDTDQDGFITKEDKRSENGIDIQNMDVKSLEGYELLFEVDIAEPSIYLKNTQVTEFKAIAPLKKIAIYSTPLEKIDVSDCEHLSELALDDTNISELDVTNNIELTYLHIFRNHLRYVDLSKNTNLFSLGGGRHTVQENYTYSKELQSVFLDMNNVVDNISKVTIEDTDDYTYDSKTGIVTLLNPYAEVVYSYNVGWITFPDDTMEVTVTGILSDADYTKVDEAIANIPADLTVYTEETVTVLNKAVNAVVNGKNITEQDIVDNYAKAINDAIANLEYKPADYAKVNEAIEKMPTDLTVYTEETVNVLNEAVNAVVNGKNITEQDIVDNYAKAINEAIASLEYKPADYAKVNEAIANIPTDLTVYTEETVNALNKAVNAVVNGKNITEQNTVDSYAQAINDAIKNLEYKPADYAKVNEAIANIPADLTVYTEETVTVLNEAVNAVINDKNITEQAVVDSYAQAINNAIANLEYKPADYANVNEAIANIPADLAVYTEETVTVLNEAVNAVEYDKNIIEQDIVDEYAKQIENAIAGLVILEIPEEPVTEIPKNEEQTTEPTTNKDTSSKSPETGAPSLAMPLIASLFILICLALVFCNKKSKNKEIEANE
ncbi:MAG: hypothetical protein K2I73_04130 [Eubacterium sp.]|nr:hypothetical protein [Eubacterium sp.]